MWLHTVKAKQISYRRVGSYGCFITGQQTHAASTRINTHQHTTAHTLAHNTRQPAPHTAYGKACRSRWISRAAGTMDAVMWPSVAIAGATCLRNIFDQDVLSRSSGSSGTPAHIVMCRW